MPLRVVNVTPNVLSNETGGDTEPNRGRRRQSAAHRDHRLHAGPGRLGSAPIYTSTDGGVNWATIVCLPGGNTTFDSSIHLPAKAATSMRASCAPTR